QAHGLSYAQAVCHYAASSLCKSAGACKSLACPAGDRKCTEPFSSETERRIRRTVYHEDRCVDRFRIFCNVVDIPLMHMCGMTVAVLKSYGLFYRIVKILCSYDA